MRKFYTQDNKNLQEIYEGRNPWLVDDTMRSDVPDDHTELDGYDSEDRNGRYDDSDFDDDAFDPRTATEQELNDLRRALYRYAETGDYGASVRIKKILNQHPEDPSVLDAMEESLGPNWESEVGDWIGVEDEEDDLDLGLGGASMEMGDEFEDDTVDGEMSVMEIEAPSPVEPEVGDLNEVLVSDLKKLAEYAGRLEEMSKTAEFDDWMVAKITKASDYVSDVWHRLDAKADFANTGFEQAQDFEVSF